jgi:hypothetical protein
MRKTRPASSYETISARTRKNTTEQFQTKIRATDGQSYSKIPFVGLVHYYVRTRRNVYPFAIALLEFATQKTILFSHLSQKNVKKRLHCFVVSQIFVFFFTNRRPGKKELLLIGDTNYHNR